MIEETIYLNLGSKDSIKDAIRALKEHQKLLNTRYETLGRVLSQEVQNEAALNYSVALGDYIEPFDRTQPYLSNGGAFVTRQAVNVRTRRLKGGKNKVHYKTVAVGRDVAFIEFGSGVNFNGSSGSSPHAKGSELGMTIGSYGKGRGSRNWWVFTDDNGTPWKSYGTPASSALYRAKESVRRRINSIAQGVFVK